MLGTIERRRVVISGLDAITPLGNTLEETWENAEKGRSGVTRISREENGERVGRINSEVDIAGQVKNFVPTDIIPKKILNRMHMSATYSSYSGFRALKDAGFIKEENLYGKNQPALIGVDRNRFGVKMGTGVGGGPTIAEIEDIYREYGDKRISAFAMLQLLACRVAAMPSILLGLKGPVDVVVAACSSGSKAISQAADTIRAGKADVMLAGGTEAANHRIAVGAFNQMHATSQENDNPEEASRPFNQNVSGFVQGDGAATAVLENLDHAIARGAEDLIYAEIIGSADTADAHHDTFPNGEGGARCIRLALADAGIYPWDIDYINAHGTSTEGDKEEILILLEVFGELITKGYGSAKRKIPISSTKSMTGHLLGAAGAVEAVLCCKMIQKGIILPTINMFDAFDNDIDFVPNQARKAEDLDIIMSDSFGFGGLNSVLIIRRYRDILSRFSKRYCLN